MKIQAWLFAKYHFFYLTPLGWRVHILKHFWQYWEHIWQRRHWLGKITDDIQYCQIFNIIKKKIYFWWVFSMLSVGQLNISQMFPGQLDGVTDRSSGNVAAALDQMMNKLKVGFILVHTEIDKQCSQFAVIAFKSKFTCHGKCSDH